MFFVLSSGRAGSRTIAKALDACSNCTCLHHPQPEFVVEASRYFYGEIDGDEIGKEFSATRPRSTDRHVYGEVNLQLSLIFPILDELYPASKFIWLLRDGRDSVASMFGRHWYDPGYTRVPKEWHDARLQGDRTGDFSPEEWASMDRFDRCCWLWGKYNDVIEDSFSRIDESRFMRVRLDQLKRDLPRVAEFLSLKPTRDVLVQKHNAAKQPVSYWHEWTAPMRAAFEKRLGDRMDRWIPEWRDSKGQWQSIRHEDPDMEPIRIRVKNHLRQWGQRTGKRIAGRLNRLRR